MEAVESGDVSRSSTSRLVCSMARCIRTKRSLGGSCALRMPCRHTSPGWRWDRAPSLVTSTLLPRNPLLLLTLPTYVRATPDGECGRKSVPSSTSCPCRAGAGQRRCSGRSPRDRRETPCFFLLQSSKAMSWHAVDGACHLAGTVDCRLPAADYRVRSAGAGARCAAGILQLPSRQVRRSFCAIWAPSSAWRLVGDVPHRASPPRVDLRVARIPHDPW